MFKWLWEHSYINIVLSYAKSIFKHVRDKHKFGKRFYGDMFKLLAKTYLRIDLKKDWIGRLYGVINPNVDIDGNFDPGTMIIEIDGDNTNNNEYVKTWIYRQLRLMGSVYALKDMYDRILLDITHVGPDEFDNYLVVFDFESRQEKGACRKRFLKRTLAILLVAAATIAVFALA